MPVHKTTCDAAAIESLLADRLSEDDQAALEQHLDACPTCRDRLEQLAADPALWSEARAFLSSDDFSINASGASNAALEGHGETGRDEAEHIRVDHIRGFFGASDDPRMLGRFGGYEIAGVIGQGGMGVVLKAWDGPLNRYVAIKALAPHLATSAAARLRFAREARAAAAIVHENVIAIHAVAEANGLPYLVMPYIKGQSLQKRLDLQGRLALAEILRVGRQIAAGLAAAHAQGLVHRDIKPANILLEDGIERLTITDFGLARAADDASLTHSGVIAGTPQFMSPEQARGDAIDQRSDLFSLGSVLYMLCTGRPPFRAESSYGILRRISDDRPRAIRDLNPDIPEWLCAIIDRLHAKAPADRFQSAADAARLFERCLAHVQQPTVVPLPEELRVARAAPGETFNETSGLAQKLTASLRRLTPWQRALLGSFAALALLAVVALYFKTRDQSLSANSARSAGAAQLDPSAASTASTFEPPTSLAASPPLSQLPASALSAAKWHDGVDAAIGALTGDVSESEQRAERFWENDRGERPAEQPQARSDDKAPSEQSLSASEIDGNEGTTKDAKDPK